MLAALLHLDLVLTAWLVDSCRAPAVQWLLLPFTAAGYGAFVWLAIATLGLALARTSAARAALWRALLAVLLTQLLVDHVAKPLVGRERPFVHGPSASPIVWVPTTTSFPSGHAASAAAGALALTRVWPAAAVPLWLLAVLIMLSRVALGVHYVGDVLAGALFGALIAWLSTTRPGAVLSSSGCAAPSVPR